MTSGYISTNGLGSLCEKLRSERLLISHEQSILGNLNTNIASGFHELSKQIWICRNEQEILRQLINSDITVSPENCCQLVNNLNNSTFIEAYKILGHYAAEIVQVYQMLMAPRAASIFLNSSEKINATYSIDELCSTVFNVLYGSCFFPEDEKNFLELLGHLISIQLVQSSDPRKVLRKGNSTFSRMYKYFSEALPINKIFLTAALHDPIMFLLSQDEMFLDIDPAKSPIRIPATERYRRFGPDENSRSYKEKVIQHRKVIVDKLVAITEKFITSILDALVIFPRSITWLVGQMYTALIEKKLISKEEAALICIDLIFTYYICSAVINPEPLGIISDTPISYIARFNLMQVGQILQTLAILPYEQRFPAYYSEILSKLDKQSMTTVMDTIFQSQSASIETISPVQVADSKGIEIYKRREFVGTLNNINILQAYLKSQAIEEITDAALRKNLKNILKKLPEQFNGITKFSMGPPTPEKTNSSTIRLKNFADRVQNVASRSHQRLMQTSSVSNIRNFHQRHLSNSTSVNTLNTADNLPINNSNLIESTDEKQIDQNGPSSLQQEVLIFTIPENDEPIGLASEEDVLNSIKRIESKNRKFANGQKKTRFLTATESIVSDRTTTDVVSDEEEVEEDEIDEAGVGSSVSSSNENAEETEDITTLPDNFSDVVPISANVSGRGSPSLSGGRLSGRDTPFSGNAPEQNNDSFVVSSTIPAIATQPIEPRRTLPSIPVTVRKQNSEGLEEKFGKFTLPPHDPSRNRDETVSLVSDSWSTDVLPASDNEGLVERAADPAVANANGQPSIAASNIPFQQNISIGRQQPPNQMARLSIVSASGSVNNPVIPSLNASENPANMPSTSPAIPPNENLNNIEDIRPYFDPKNLTKCRAFLDAKRKLRMALSSSSSFQNNSEPSRDAKMKHQENNFDRKTEDVEATELHQMLKLLLAESINNCDKKQTAQIREVQRCLSIFDIKCISTLLRVIKRDHRKRMAYIHYLQQSRLNLLQLNYCLERMRKRIQRDIDLTSECLVEILVRFSLQKKDQSMRQFVHDFQCLRVQDEKIDLVESHLRHLCGQLIIDPMWHFDSLENIEYARKCLERSLMAHIYMFALFPNSDADYYRDEVLTKSIQQLSSTISVDHHELAIPKSLHAECPWPSAQAELAIINAYKSPRDKMACITRCCETIENLIILSSGRTTASADDILPVLVFVIIKANPPALLSNIQFIDGFYAKRMHGSEAYSWIQFNSAVEFLKTLLNKLCN